MEQFELESEVLPPKQGRTRRVEDFGITFSDGLCVGWVFDVPECFRPTLDIMLSTYVNKQLSKQQGLKVFSDVWTRGNPPLRSFATGDVFYDPPGIRKMVWSEALLLLRRSVQVIDAKADTEDGNSGWAKIKMTEYANGKVLSTSEVIISQAELEYLLRTGCLSTSSDAMTMAASGG